MYPGVLTYLEWVTKNYATLVNVERILYRGQSKYQVIEVLSTKQFGKLLILDGKTQLSTSDEFIYHEALVHPALTLHPKPQRVLIIGGGDGGALREVLKHKSVREVTLVELDPEVIEVVKTYLPEVPSGAFEDKRVKIVFTDGRKYVEGCIKEGSLFDIVICDVTDPGGPSRYLYTLEFYKMIKSILNKPGVIVTHAESPFFHLKEFLTITVTLSEVFEVARPYKAWIPSFGAPWAFVLASNDRELDPYLLSKAQVERVIHERALSTLLKYYGPDIHLELFALPRFLVDKLEEAKKEKMVATDKRPIYMEV